MASVAILSSVADSFNQLKNSFMSSFEEDTVVASPSVENANIEANDSQIPLFATSTPTPANRSPSSDSQQPLFSATPPSSLELPPTQDLKVRLKKLRNVSTSSSPRYRVVGLSDQEDDDDEHVDDIRLLKRQLDDLKSELTALRLQFDINEEERKTLAKENDELRQKISLSSIDQERESPDRMGLDLPDVNCETHNREFDGVTSNGGFTTATSKAKKKKKRKHEAAASVAATSPSSATTTSAAPSTTAGLPTIDSAASDASAATAASAQQTRNIHILHDSNTKANHDELKTHYANIIKQTNKSKISEDIQFHLHPSYTLEKTLHDIKKLNLTSNDHIIITPLTNNARITNSGRHSTTRQTSNKQSEII